MSKPWQRDPRSFKHPALLDWIQTNRGRLIAALLTLIRAWVAAGKPKIDVPQMGGFDEWKTIIGGILAYAGVSGFLDNSDQLYKHIDTETTEWENFLIGWEDLFDTKPITVADLLASELNRWQLPAAAFNDKGEVSPKSLGWLLRRKVNVRVGNRGLYIIKAEQGGRVATWQLRTSEKT